MAEGIIVKDFNEILNLEGKLIDLNTSTLWGRKLKRSIDSETMLATNHTSLKEIADWSLGEDVYTVGYIFYDQSGNQKNIKDR